jgi:hypothetical protein
MSTDLAPPPIMEMNIGSSGGGKTGALLALAKRGFTLRIADFDNAAAQVFRGIMYDAAGAVRADIQVFADRLKNVAGKLRIAGFGQTAWERFLSAMDKWPSTGNSVFDWGPDTIFVTDTLTHLSNASMRYIMKLNGREGENPSQPNWGDAMRGVEDYLAQLRFGPTKCHVIVNAHIVFLEGEEGVVEGLPMSLGAKLSPKIPSYFPVMVRMRNKGGAKSERVIMTMGDSRVGLKVPAPDLPAELPQADGLATIFARLGWPKPPVVETQPAQAQPAKENAA